MQEKITIALIQTKLAWENPKKNRKRLEKKINILEAVNLVILPEMFTSGFTMTPENVAETMDGETIMWMKQLAAKNDFAIMGSIVIKEHHYFVNRLLFIAPNGNLEYYDKRHSFTLVGEDSIYRKGHKRLIINYNGWKICPLICYDLRFPVWARNDNAYDLLVYVAN